MLWQRMSGKVDEAYRGTQVALQRTDKAQETTAPKKSVLNMDLNDLLKNSAFMKKKFAKLEQEKLKLLEELQGPGKIRSKEAKVYKFTAKNKDGKLETGITVAYTHLVLKCVGYLILCIIMEKKWVIQSIIFRLRN